MAELSREDLQRLARLGAQRRLEELRLEEESIRAAFPDLFGGARGRRGRRPGRPPKSESADTGAPAAKAKRPARYHMTAAQRRAVSERMKKYWAARRRAKG